MQKSAGPGAAKVSTTGSVRREPVWKHRHASDEWLHLPAAGRCRGRQEWGQEACWGSSGWERPDQAASDPLHHPAAAPKQKVKQLLRYFPTAPHGTTEHFISYRLGMHSSPALINTLKLPSSNTVLSLSKFFFPSLKKLYRRCIQGFSGPDNKCPTAKTWQSKETNDFLTVIDSDLSR